MKIILTESELSNYIKTLVTEEIEEGLGLIEPLAFGIPAYMAMRGSGKFGEHINTIKNGFKRMRGGDKYMVQLFNKANRLMLELLNIDTSNYDKTSPDVKLYIKIRTYIINKNPEIREYINNKRTNNTVNNTVKESLELLGLAGGLAAGAIKNRMEKKKKENERKTAERNGDLSFKIKELEKLLTELGLSKNLLNELMVRINNNSNQNFDFEGFEDIPE